MKKIELMNYLNSARSSLFRLEYLQFYNIPSEKEMNEQFDKTGTINLSQMKEWFDFLEKKHKQGVKLQRVRLIKFPLNNYTKSSVIVYKESVKHGDEIKLITETQFLKLNIPNKDFWLIDDKIVLLMNYSPTAEYLGFTLKNKNIDKYKKYKKVLIENSVPVRNFSI